MIPSQTKSIYAVDALAKACRATQEKLLTKIGWQHPQAPISSLVSIMLQGRLSHRLWFMCA